MSRNRVLVVVCFLAAFAAGLAVGMVLARPAERPRHHSWLMSELKLTAQQRDQMGKIWSEVMEGSGRQHGDQRRAIAEERDKAIAGLLTGEQQPKYEQILQDHTRKLGELAQQRKAAFDQAVERTKQILTAEQAKLYDELLKKQRERGFGGPRGMGPRQGRGGPASRPATSTSQSVSHPASHGEE